MTSMNSVSQCTNDSYNNTPSPKPKPATAASNRTSSVLVVPHRPSSTSNAPRLLRPVSQTQLSSARESISFQHFTSTALPTWTQFFDSPLWTQTILQLSHHEPAIKHGILALSEMHQRFTQHRPVFTTRSDDFAFLQYSHAVHHSHALLQRFTAGAASVGVETVLVACILFTCFENLAGRYETANMHLRNGLRILAQHRREKKSVAGGHWAHVEGVLGRFDLQAMTFSDDKSPYEYVLGAPPACPQLSERYEGNEAARDELVGLLRCVMWSWGVLEMDGDADQDPGWKRVTRDLVGAFEAWEARFAEFESGYLSSGRREPKVDAGNALLNMYAVMMRVVKAEFGMGGEMAWDAHLEEFKRIVELAEALPGFRAEDAKKARERGGMAMSLRLRPLAPKASMPSSPGTSTVAGDSDSAPSTRTSSPPVDTLMSFSPSFELSPIVPLFMTAHRCRDPHLRRRAIRLLLRSRRRDGAWDSFAAGLVVAEAMRTEEGSPRRSFGDEDFLVLAPGVKQCADVPLHRRIGVIHVSVSVVEGSIETTFKMVDGTEEELVVGFA